MWPDTPATPDRPLHQHISLEWKKNQQKVGKKICFTAERGKPGVGRYKIRQLTQTN